MLKLFGGGKPDHPMADIKQARQILANLPVTDAFKSLEEITHWIESVIATEGFRLNDRLELFKLLDESAQPHQRKLSRDYLAAPRLQKFQENRLWTTTFNFWKKLGDAYFMCVSQYQSGAKGAETVKAALPLMAARGMRAMSSQLKWLQLRYGPVDESVWDNIAKLYMCAEGQGIHRQSVTLYPGAPGETSVEQEFVKTLMLWASSPDGLMPLQLEIAERITSHFAASFVLEKGVRQLGTHCCDLDERRPPARLSGVQMDKPTQRFFGAGAALAQLEQLFKVVEKGTIPDSINLGAAYKPGIVLDVLKHLAMYWSPQAPARRHERHKIMVRLNVVNGFPQVVENLDQEQLPGSVATESWVAENVSAGGFGAVVPELKPEWMRVGSLLGIKPEGVPSWGVGIIRRLNRDDQRQGHVGVQTLAKASAGVKVKPVDSKWGSQPGGGEFEMAVLLENGAGSGEATLALKANSFTTGQSFEMTAHGKKHLLMPIKLVEQGQDFDLARFRVMERQESTEE